MQLAGRKALVTGARRNIGRGIAQALAQAGCDVGINDLERDQDAETTLRLIAEQGREAEFFAADVADSRQVEAMFATCYGVAKAGVIRLTQSMAVDLGPHGIRCNAIQPGYMDTAQAFGSAPLARVSAPQRLHPFIPSQRYGTPEDIGRAVVFLCSPAGADITGVSLPVDGGLLVTGVPS